MALTTPQLYALFAIAACVAMLIGITYCTGLRTGRRAADRLIHKLEKINSATSNSLAKRTADLIETNRKLDAREAALSKLRQCLREEQCDHDNVTKQLREDLNREVANRLTHDDWLMLKLAAKQLGIVAEQFTKSGSNKTNQAELAQTRIHDIADRVKEALDEVPLLLSPAEHGISDTDLIEWLDKEATYHGELEYGELRFSVISPPEGFEHTRDVLTLAAQQQRQRDYGQAMGAAA
ncbi:hypothetical protein [Pseudomonas sp. CC6-YY-74]|uniref:hypothetical protein n=1 Tax=Pseudomonas sp. CC6-YY-74 TaxID=1930532 RepID=UPI0009A228FC|nr:hypothetical protein [Pseudomonas sp. CC6-YY-74]